MPPGDFSWVAFILEQSVQVPLCSLYRISSSRGVLKPEIDEGHTVAVVKNEVVHLVNIFGERLVLAQSDSFFIVPDICAAGAAILIFTRKQSQNHCPPAKVYRFNLHRSWTFLSAVLVFVGREKDTPSTDAASVTPDDVCRDGETGERYA